MQYTYFGEIISDEDGFMHMTYGIKSLNGKICIKDITMEKENIRRLCRNLNSSSVESCQIFDVIYDFICSVNTVTVKRLSA